MKIETEAEYDTAMAELVKLMDRDPHPESEEGMRMIRLVDAIEEYEKERFPLEGGST